MMGMLAWFVHIFVENNALTPDSILILFILSVLALAWAVFTLFSYHRSSANARFVALVDICFVGALIAGVYLMRGIGDADCTDPSPTGIWYSSNHIPVPNFGWEISKPCSMLKASWAFAIMNIIFFATTAVAAFSHGDHLSYDDRVVVTRRRYHSGRHSQRQPQPLWWLPIQRQEPSLSPPRLCLKLCASKKEEKDPIKIARIKQQPLTLRKLS